MITRYTLGFIFSEDLKEVLLLKMNKPGRWNDGLINGVGGHIETKESYEQCMIRECEEECGLKIVDWKYAGVYAGSQHTHNEFKIFTYFATIKKSNFSDFNSPEGELSWYKVDDIMKLQTVSNMKWMIPFCLDRLNNNIHTSFDIKYC